MHSVIVIGAGMAGLTAARELQQHGFSVTVLDKGRSVGGRMATRRLLVDSRIGRADHGAQYITAYTERFTRLVQDMAAQNVIEPWHAYCATTAPKRARYIAHEGMASVAKYLARGINVHVQERVVRIVSSRDTWTVHTESHHTYNADALLVTAPIPQALALLESADTLVLSDAERAALEAVVYVPCIALMLALDRKHYLSISTLPLTRFEGKRTVMWIADNTAKGISPDVPVLTIHTSSDFAREYWETDDGEVYSVLVGDMREYIPAEAIQSYSLHRWRYSRVVAPFARLCCPVAASPAGLVLAGDGFATECGMLTRIEDAALSGWAAAEYLVSLYR
ncbi:MAG: FAD-dependent oxidoreductase [Bacteroidota bacterium]|nr:FAD-dependent oxidoreductase [Candidatus Kapabacteria bacterium]MDW8219540.1 FAD-dependent oxidoreductase [Bacteroidota bacterium]